MTQGNPDEEKKPPAEYWFNTKNGMVEFGLLTAAPYRVGPFQTAGEAERALEILAERARAWKLEDEADR